MIRRADIDMGEAVWHYKPSHHKTAWRRHCAGWCVGHGRGRNIKFAAHLAGAEPIMSVCFDDPWSTNTYPSPAAGSYIRFHRGDRPATGEPE